MLLKNYRNKSGAAKIDSKSIIFVWNSCSFISEMQSKRNYFLRGKALLPEQLSPSILWITLITRNGGREMLPNFAKPALRLIKAYANESDAEKILIQEGVNTSIWKALLHNTWLFSLEDDNWKNPIFFVLYKILMLSKILSLGFPKYKKEIWRLKESLKHF